MRRRKIFRRIEEVPIHERLKAEGTPIDTPEKSIMSAMVLHMDIWDYDGLYSLNKLIAKYPEVAKDVLGLKRS